jgi:hypothetical protein
MSDNPKDPKNPSDPLKQPSRDADLNAAKPDEGFEILNTTDDSVASDVQWNDKRSILIAGGDDGGDDGGDGTGAGSSGVPKGH